MKNIFLSMIFGAGLLSSAQAMDERPKPFEGTLIERILVDQMGEIGEYYQSIQEQAILEEMQETLNMSKEADVDKLKTSLNSTAALGMPLFVNLKLSGGSFKKLKDIVTENPKAFDQVKSLKIQSKEKIEGLTNFICEFFRNLTSLDLENNKKIEIKDIQAIVTSPNMCQLTSLNLGGTDIGSKVVEVIVNSKNMSKLEFLDLRGNAIGLEGVKAIVTSPNMMNLTSLGLRSNYIDLEGVKAIVNSILKLTSLDLSWNHIGLEGAEAIAISPNMSELTSLVLSHSDIGLKGVNAIIESEYMLNLTSLNLVLTAGPEEIKTILFSKLSKLSKLYLSELGLTLEDQEALRAAHPNLKIIFKSPF